MSFLKGKRALIVGLASNRSIAYGIAKSFHEQGAELAFTFQNEKLQSRVETMASEFGSTLTCPCDVSKDDEIKGVFDYLKKHWDGMDILVHSVAYAPADQLEGHYVDVVNREGFRLAHDISSYSFAALAQASMPLMRENGAMLTLSYLGAERAVPFYNVMGIAKASLEANMRYLAYGLGEKQIRVNAISAGPIKTLAASGIKGFKAMLKANESQAPLKRNVTTDEVGNAAAFLCSDLASGITGEVLHVDAGFHSIALALGE